MESSFILLLTPTVVYQVNGLVMGSNPKPVGLYSRKNIISYLRNFYGLGPF